MDHTEEQHLLEDLMVSKGVERYYSMLENRGIENTGPGLTLRRRALAPLSAAVAEAQAPQGRGRPKRGHAQLREVPPEVAADIALRRILPAAIEQQALIKVAKSVGTAIEWHVRDAQLVEANNALWNRKQEQLKTTTNPTFRRASIDGTVRASTEWARQNNEKELLERMESVKGTGWTEQDKLDVGFALIDLMASSTALIVVETTSTGRNKKKTSVRLTEQTETWLKEQHEYHALLRPVFLPMVTEPAPWAALDSGGYLDNSKAKVSFIKGVRRDQDFDLADCGDVFDAVNAIQATPLRVNRAVFDVMRQVYEQGSGIGRVPPKYPEDAYLPIPEYTEAQKRLTKEQRRADRHYYEVTAARRHAYTRNAEIRSEVHAFAGLMQVTPEFVDRDRFWLPYKLDWRQRCYPIPVALNPQGNQFNRSLIEFAEGSRMGDNDNAAAWLAIHGANSYGVDKVSYEDRIAWVEENEDKILESAMFPFDCDFWQQADGGAKAWIFLAFCFEWLGYRIAGDDFVTHLPVGLDGSNSGLQHLSAMMRDSDGAAATNVAPSEEPADIYTEICESVEQKLSDRIDAEHAGIGAESDEWAYVWKGHIDRKICKQPTMTYTYGATLTGMTQQIENALRGLDKKVEGERPCYLTFTKEDQNNREAARYLAPIVLEAIRGRLPKAAAAMDFLIETARVSASIDVPLRWTTPTGLPIIQKYPKFVNARDNVYVDGRRHQIAVQQVVPGKVNKKRQANGASPNFVHSMDSTHLMWTVLKCSDNYGMTDFAMIHDSFGTHATNCDVMAFVLRETFVSLYSEDRLAAFKEDVKRRLPEELHEQLPELPERGDFDLESVVDAEYFFA